MKLLLINGGKIVFLKTNLKEGFPSAGRIAHELWGGNAGRSWSEKNRNRIMRQRKEKGEPKAQPSGKVDFRHFLHHHCFQVTFDALSQF